MTNFRTRFAPSPTGFLHLGNARTALFCYLFAKHNRGQFILRIEDTDQERLVEGSEKSIMEDLQWMGLSWDEGPDCGGPLGPYRCSERYDLYEKYLKQIQKMSRVYRCFCSAEQLDQDRKLLSSQSKPLKYVGRCREISEAESQKRAQSGEKFVWRMQVDEAADVIQIQDTIRQQVSMSPAVIGDFVLCRSNSVPVFLFANAIDDALMEISHVIRGEDHLSNTFRQVLIYRALGFPEPVFAHLPMIGASDGGKLSKRAGSLGIRSLREEGFIPEGVINYLALLGWSPGDTAATGEKFTKSRLVELFDLGRVHKSRALFDFSKLRFLNQAHMLDKPTDELVKLVPSRNPAWDSIWPQAIELVRHDAHTLEELYKVESFLREPEYKTLPIVKETLSQGKSVEALAKSAQLLQEAGSDHSSPGDLLQTIIKQVGQSLGIKGKELFFPFRMALTASDAGPELKPLANVLGKGEVLKRIQSAIHFANDA
jgi:glutamyl-tRNA synthetase/nondiscriminating glutamyl-tRNA synthetase